MNFHSGKRDRMLFTESQKTNIEICCFAFLLALRRPFSLSLENNNARYYARIDIKC